MSRSQSRLEVISRQIAGNQHGVISRSQMRAAGIPRTTIDRRVGSLFFPLFLATYAVGRPQVSQDGVWMAGVLAAGPGAVLSARSAAAVWGFIKPKPMVEVIRKGHRRTDRGIFDLDDRTVRSVPLLIRRTRFLPEQERMSVRSIPVASPARALMEMAPSLTTAGFRRAFIEADRLGLLSDADLDRVLSHGRGRPGAGALRSLAHDRIPNLDRAKSLLEGLMLDVCHQEGIEPPEVNVMIGNHEVDCVWPQRRVAVEMDSYGFHRGQEKFEEDLARNNRLCAEGWVLLRFTWRRLTREPEKVVEEVRAALRGSRNGSGADQHAPGVQIDST